MAILGHGPCGAAIMAEGVINGTETAPSKEFAATVEMFKKHNCATHEQVEELCPELQRKIMLKIYKKLRINAKDVKIMARRVDTPNLTASSDSDNEIVMTLPLRIRYKDLGVDTSSRKIYYLSNNLLVALPDLLLAVGKLRGRKVTAISHGPQDRP